jgi:hypothetical protein
MKALTSDGSITRYESSKSASVWVFSVFENFEDVNKSLIASGSFRPFTTGELEQFLPVRLIRLTNFQKSAELDLEKAPTSF